MSFSRAALLLFLGACQSEAEPHEPPAVPEPDEEVVEAVLEVEPAEPVVEEPAAELPPPLTHYKGRKIATTMHWKGADWLTRETRQDEEDGAHAAREVLRLGVARAPRGEEVLELRVGDGTAERALREAFHDLARVGRRISRTR